MAPRSLRRVLVANRGEIARRLIRGAHDAGCEAVAVYAQDDADSPHVAEADAAVLLPGASLAETYLSAAELVRAARVAGADALHPGYGFLSENPALAEACDAAGIVWVGPPPDAMRVMGHKARAKEVVAEAGVPVLPSAVVATGADEAALDAAADAVGYPLLVKASAGGGGRGMRLVREPGELREAVASARREAAAAFGSDDVFLERYLEAPRHVEVQVIGDTHGTVLHLFDRECSVQRRHQKVVEEAPAVLVPESVRADMWEAAVSVARAVGYVGAGTVECLVDVERFLLPRDEHAAPGRARRHRAGHRTRPGGSATGSGRGSARSPSTRPRCRRTVTPWRCGSAPNGPGRTTGRRPARSATCGGPRGRDCGPTAPSSPAAS